MLASKSSQTVESATNVRLKSVTLIWVTVIWGDIKLLCVVYFDQLFFSHFQPFLFISNLFQWFHTWNQQKMSEKEQKKVFLSTPQGWLTCKSWSTPYGGTSKLSFFGWFFYFFNIFCPFSTDFGLFELGNKGDPKEPIMNLTYTTSLVFIGLSPRLCMLCTRAMLNCARLMQTLDHVS